MLTPTAPIPLRGIRTFYLIAGLLLLAFNMRPALVSVSPIINIIGIDLHVSTSALSLLTAIPVLCFGFLAPLAPLIASKLTLSKAILASLALLLIGIALRSAPQWDVVMFGTVILGVGIAIMNVLAPSAVKQYFPKQVGLFTGLYITVLNAAAALAAASSVKLTTAVSGAWNASLIIWAIPVLPALVLWKKIANDKDGPHSPDESVPMIPLLKKVDTWTLIGFTAAQSVVYYSVLTWLPAIYNSYGYSSTDSGFLLAVVTGVSIPVALVTPVLSLKLHSQIFPMTFIGAAAMVGLSGILVTPPSTAIFFCVILGIGIGGAFPLAVTAFIQRARTVQETSALSTLAQAGAYVIAAFGPFTLGFLFDLRGNWTSGLIILIACAGLEIFFGLFAGRPAFIS